MESVVVPFERRVVLSLAALYAFRMLGLFMLLPVLSLYGQGYAGATPALLGLALGAYGFSQALLQIPFGVLADRVGRKPVILGGLIIFALGSLVAAQADTVYELIVGRFLQGCGAISAAVMALLTDLTSEENRTKAMATIGASIGASFSLALILGPLLAAWGGMPAIFWLTALLALIGIYLLYAQVPKVARTPRRQEPGALPRLFKQVLHHPELLRLNLGIFVLHFVLMASFMVLPLILEQELAIARDKLWMVYFPLLTGAFVAMLPFIILAEKRRQMKPVFICAVILLGAMELTLAVAPAVIWLTLGAIFLFFMAFNLLEASLPSMVSKVAPVGAKGTATGIYSSCQFFGAFAGGATGGWLLQHQGTTAVFLACGALVAIWLSVAWFMRTPRYLASLLIPLQAGGDSALLAERLRQMEGVEEVLVLDSEATAYVRVDPKVVDRKTITAAIEAQ